MKTTHLPSSAPHGRFDVINRYACACDILAPLAATILSLAPGKGDIEFP
jgi:hypothetical protein